MMSKNKQILFYSLTVVILAATVICAVLLHGKEISKDIRGVFFLTYLLGAFFVYVKSRDDGDFHDPYRGFWPAALLCFLIGLLTHEQVGWLGDSLLLISEAALPIYLLRYALK